MKEPLLISDAMERGWIFQECTFGGMDPVMVKKLAHYLAGWRQIDMRTYIQICLQIAYLLERRGYDKIFEKKHPEIKDFWEGIPGRYGGYFKGRTAEPFRLLGPGSTDIFMELKYTGEEDVSFTVKHVIEHCIMDTEEQLERWLEECLCVRAIDTVHNEDEFCKLFSKAMLKAFLSSKLTLEHDRTIAITGVSQAVLSKFGVHLSPQAIMTKCWQYFINQTLKYNEVWAFVIRSSIHGQRMAFLHDVVGSPVSESDVWLTGSGSVGEKFKEQMSTVYKSLGVTKWFQITSHSVNSAGATMIVGCNEINLPLFYLNLPITKNFPHRGTEEIQF